MLDVEEIIMRELQLVKARLRDLGIGTYQQNKPEVRELARILRPTEEIEAVAFGWYAAGFAMLVCTSERFLMVDKYPMDLKIDDIPYFMVAGTETNLGLYWGKLRVFTRPKNFDFWHIQNPQARQMSEYLDAKLSERQQQDRYNEAAVDNFAMMPNETPAFR
jgi:hypothetical protein